MLSLASATKLLERCQSGPAAAPILDALGFRHGLIPLGAGHTALLGLPVLGAPMLARGHGGLRCLVFETTNHGAIRTDLARIAGRLTTHAPQMLWLIVAIDAVVREVAIAAADASQKSPRVAALIVQLSNIVDSDAETLCGLCGVHADSDVGIHCRWLEILGRESVSKRFFRTLERIVDELAWGMHPRPPAAEASELALLNVSRLLFLSFLETKGWLDRDHDFLANRFANCMLNGGRFHRNVLRPLFFGTLNTHPRNRAHRARAFGRIPFLNGGLFATSALERRNSMSCFSDETLGNLFCELLDHYRFTAREDTTTFTQSAIDPEMLGKAFECLMSSLHRKTSGAFYTPQQLVAHLSSSALSSVLASSRVPRDTVSAALAGEIPEPSVRKDLLDSIESMRILDPACGSGAFLVHALEELSRLRLRLGDLRPLHSIRRTLLTTAIFGVDVNPTAVWLCELRLWLSMAIEDPEIDPLRVSALPNLDRNIRVGDSLSGDSFAGAAVRAGASRVSSMRARYSRATGPRKRSLARSLDSAERRLSMIALTERLTRQKHQRREILSAVRTRDLFGERKPPDPSLRKRLSDVRVMARETRNEIRQLSDGGSLPFSFGSGFADVASRGGFDLVIGNPPWVRTKNLKAASRVALRRRYAVFRNSAWTNGAAAAAAGTGFSSQIDVAALFVERSLELLRPDGVAALLLPAKLWQSLAGGGVRRFLQESSRLIAIHDLSEAPQLFDAAVYPSMIVARRLPCVRPTDGAPIETAEKESSTKVFVHRSECVESWQTPADRLGVDPSPGSPWLLLPPAVRAAFDRVSQAGVPLARTPIGRPLLGVKTGCNDAFIVDPRDGRERSSPPDDQRLTRVLSARGERDLELSLLRPLVRGEQVTAWKLKPAEGTIIWTHDGGGGPMRSLPPAALDYLSQWRRNLERRVDARGKPRWWMLFRTESADSSVARVVWADIGRSPRAALIPAGDNTVPLNTCYVAQCAALDDALALIALLNSTLVAAWLNAVAEPARGGYRRYLGWTMAMLPLPHDWSRATRILAPIAEQAIGGNPPEGNALKAAVQKSYGLTDAEVAPLLQWRI